MSMAATKTAGAEPARLSVPEIPNFSLALKLAQAGLPVFPCAEAPGLAYDKDGKPKGAKAPYTANGFKDATTDTARIQGWWAQWPGAVPGVPTGEASGLSVIDGDLDRDTGEAVGERQVAKLDLLHPDAVKVRTQSGGVQIIYKHVEGARTSSHQVASHIDTRGAGGYIIAPGARMQDGATYRYEGRTLSKAIEAGNLPAYPLEAVEAAIKAEKAKKARRQTEQAERVQIDTGGSYGQTEASEAETLEVVRALLSEAPNTLCREDWVKLAVSLRVAYGDTLRDAFTSFSLGYMGGTPCTAQDAAHVWQSSGAAHTVTDIRPALALLKQAVGPERFKQAYRNTFDKTREQGRSFSPAKAMAEELNLVTDKTGRPYWNTANAVEILTSHPAWRGVLAHNDFTRRRVLLKPIPGTRCNGQRNLEDDDATAVLSWFNRNGFPKASANVVLAAMHAVARRNTFDPLKDYLTGLRWDGEQRLEEWLITYCGAEMSDYTREIGKRWMISAVARAFKPGCKADHMIVLEGEQGARKSSALAALAGEAWFTDALPPMNTKDASDFLRGRWIVEVAELEAMRREMDAVKAFISRQVESFRPAYGRETVDEPRRCIFAGTTNKDAWLRDETGGRRFWPVKVGTIDLDAIKRDRAQIWAEAVALFRAGEKWWLEGEVEGTAREEQASRMADDPWLMPILEAVEGRSEITIREIMATMGFVPADMTRKDSDRVAAILKRQGWKRTGRATSGPLKGQAVFTPPD